MVSECGPDGSAAVKPPRRWRGNFIAFDFVAAIPGGVVFQGHDEWSECQELGIIGDMLASPDFVTKASLLVVQQQRIRGRLVTHNVNATPVPNQRDQLLHDVPIHETFSPSCTISVDKYDKM